MAPPDRLGRYQLLDRLGAGGMAEVHLARVQGAAGFEKLVVVKRLLPALAAEKDYVKGFVDEGRISATLSHANVVSTFDFGEADGSYFIAMEFVEGKNLRAVLDALEAKGARMPIPIALYLAAETCRGLDHAHTRTDASGAPLRIVHRDVSPQNVVISYDGDVKVLDFGIATSTTRETRTAPGIVKGKLRYIAPEQITGGAVDGRADLFAAGAVLHEMLHGRRALPDLDSAEIIPWVVRAEFPPPRPGDDVPPDVDALLARALAADPAARPASCGEMARDLARLLAHHFPDFSPGDLAAVVRELFAQEMQAERDWVHAALESSELSRAAPPSLARADAPLSESRVLTLATAGGPVPPLQRIRSVVVPLALLGFALALALLLWLPHARKARALTDARAALAAGDADRAFEVAAGALDHGADPRLEAVARAALRSRLDSAYESEGLINSAPDLVRTAAAAHPSLGWLTDFSREADAAATVHRRLHATATTSGDAVRLAWEIAAKDATDPDVPWAEARVLRQDQIEPGVALFLYEEGVKRGHPLAPVMLAALEDELESEPPQVDDGRDALALFATRYPEERAAFASRYMNSSTNAIAALSARAVQRAIGGTVPPDPVNDALERLLDGTANKNDAAVILAEGRAHPERVDTLLLALQRVSARYEELAPLENALDEISRPEAR